MNQKFLKLGDVEIEKWKFSSSENPINVGDVNTDKIVMSDKFLCTKREF